MLVDINENLYRLVNSVIALSSTMILQVSSKIGIDGDKGARGACGAYLGLGDIFRSEENMINGKKKGADSKK